MTIMLVRRVRKAIYGAVWDALHVELLGGGMFRILPNENGRRRRLAVKRMGREYVEAIPPGGGENPTHEISALCLMRNPGHANVLQIVHALRNETDIFLVTPFVDGGEMFDWVQKSPRPAREADVRPLFRQIVEAMQYIHLQGICHHDMSLENTLIDRERRNAYVIDFGMALAMPMNSEGQRMMSVHDGRTMKPSYCPREVFKHQSYDGVKVDVFAAGAMLFMMLTGCQPFGSATRNDANYKLVVYRGNVRTFLERNGLRMSDEAISLIKQTLAHNAEDRLLPAEMLQHPWFNMPS
eukprot:jgi/Undpi1/2273/HiC_scaffold_13.g05659.m1